MSEVEAASDVPVYSIVDDPAFETDHRHAGVEEAFSLRTPLGRGPANEITTAVSAELEGGVEIGRDLPTGELPLHPGSALCWQTFAESGITDRTGGRVIGAWSTGEFRTPPFPDLVLEECTVLLVIGSERDLERIREPTHPRSDATAGGRWSSLATASSGRRWGTRSPRPGSRTAGRWSSRSTTTRPRSSSVT